MAIKFRHYLKREAVTSAFKGAKLLTFETDTSKEAEVFWRRLDCMKQPYEMHEEAKSILVRSFGVECLNEDGLMDFVHEVSKMLPESEHNCFSDEWENKWDE